MKITESAKLIQPYLTELRRELHKHPEISGREEQTAAFVARELRKTGVPDLRENVGGHGVLAEIHGALPGGTIALRADMDALQIAEETGLPFASCNPGVMHACGHDMHTAILLGAARLLAERREELAGTVRLVFQPAEEMSPVGGSRGMIAAGALEGVDAVFGLHVWPKLPAGTVGTKAGPLMAASDHFTVRIEGKSSHAAEPENSVDALVAGAQFVTAAQTIVSRNTSPLASTVITFGRSTAGTRYNIIAERCEIEGTCRTLSQASRQLAERRLQEVLDGVCRLSGCKGSLDYEYGYMPVINDAAMAERVLQRAGALFGKDAVVHVDEPSMCAEDFAFYLENTPGAFAWLGCGVGENPAPLHNGCFTPDEDILWRGAALLADLAFYRE